MSRIYSILDSAAAMLAALRESGSATILLAALVFSVLLNASHRAEASMAISTNPKAWAVVLCKFKDEPISSRPVAFFETLFTETGAGRGGMFDFWRDQSYGQLDLRGSVVRGWYTMPYTKAEQWTKSRTQRWLDCARMAENDIYFPSYTGIVAIWNVGFDTFGSFAGATLNGLTKQYGMTALDPYGWEPTVVSHEMGHGYGLSHSWSSSPEFEYGDHWDPMSAWTSAWTFNPSDSPDFGREGPGLPAYQRKLLGAIPVERRFIFTGGAPRRVQLTSLENPNGSDFLVAETSSQGDSYYTVEFRKRDGWDSGIPRDAVVIHQVRAGRSYLVPTRGKDFVAGDVFQTSDGLLIVRVLRIDAAAGVAEIEMLDGAEALPESPAAISWGPGRMDVFMRSSYDSVRHRYFDASSGTWSSWEELFGFVRGEPAVASLGVGHLDVFARDAQNNLQHRVFMNGQWSDWQPLGESPGGPLASAPAVVSWGPGRLDVFARGSDNTLQHKTFAYGNWSYWESLGGSLTSAPSVASWGQGHFDVYIRGTDARIYHKWFLNGGWSGWEFVSGWKTTSAPAAESWGPGHVEVFYRDRTSGSFPDLTALFHKRFSNGGWSSSESLGN